MPRDGQKPLGAEGSGFGSVENGASPRTFMGIQEQELPSSSSQAAGGVFGGSLLPTAQCLTYQASF